MLRSGTLVSEEVVLFEVLPIDKVKHLTIKSVRKYGHLTLVGTLRLYIRSANFLKYQYDNLKTRIINSGGNGSAEDKTRVSKFLKMMSEYKEKIREIKHQIKEEENL
jgi:hypothetical protein